MYILSSLFQSFFSATAICLRRGSLMLRRGRVRLVLEAGSGSPWDPFPNHLSLLPRSLTSWSLITVAQVCFWSCLRRSFFIYVRLILIYYDHVDADAFHHQVSFLDLPDLAALSQLSSYLARLSSDPVLHRTRILVVAPSRISHGLFGRSPQGIALRPTVGDLINRGVIRGLAIARAWRMGSYFYSPSVRVLSLFSFIFYSYHSRIYSPSSCTKVESASSADIPD
jgi:hypothetical protein